MKIKMTGRKWATGAHQRTMRRLVRHAVSHYPKDHALHSAVASALDATCSASKLSKAGTRKRKATRRRAPGRAQRSMMRTPMRRRRAMRSRTAGRIVRRGMRRRA